MTLKVNLTTSISNTFFQAGSVTVDADDEEQPEADASGDEEVMEVDDKAVQSVDPMEVDSTIVAKVSEEDTSTGPGGPAASKATTVTIGLPQSKEELESLISTIHNSVNNSVLPRLHKCLTSKV